MVHTLTMKHIKVDIGVLIWKDVHDILWKVEYIYIIWPWFLRKSSYMKECIYRKRLRIYINYKRWLFLKWQGTFIFQLLYFVIYTFYNICIFNQENKYIYNKMTKSNFRCFLWVLLQVKWQYILLSCFGYWSSKLYQIWLNWPFEF